MASLRRLAVVLSVVALLAWISASLESRIQQPATGLILGRAIEAGSGEPIAGAVVYISNQNEPRQYAGVITDRDGQFVFSGLSAGTFMLWAEKRGHQPGSLGLRRPGWEQPEFKPLTLANDDRIGDVTLRLWKYGAIGGTVLDERGDPVAGINVRAYRRMFLGGHAKFTDDKPAQTDDRGIYRINGLVAGEYVVGIVQDARSSPLALVEAAGELRRAGNRQAYFELLNVLFDTAMSGQPSNRRVDSVLFATNQPMVSSAADSVFVYPTQFYPATPSASSARSIALEPGQEATGIDFTVKPLRTYRVSGRLVGDRGPMSRMPVRLLSASADDFEMAMMGPATTTASDDAGRFTFVGVAPGEYQLSVLKGPGGEEEMGMESMTAVTTSSDGVTLSRGTTVIVPTGSSQAPTYVATMPLAISDADVTDLTLTVHTGVRLSGRVEFAGTRAAPASDQLRKLRLQVEARDGRSEGHGEFELTGRVAEDGRFETVELPPGSYFLRTQKPPTGWVLDAVTVGGRDVSDVPVDVGDQPIGNIVIRLTDQPTALTGTVRTSTRDDRLDEALVVAFPVDRARWVDYGRNPRQLQRVLVTSDGAFTIQGLPAGEYYVAAIRDDFLSDWRRPAFLELVSRTASRVTIAAGSPQSLALEMRTVR